MRAAYAFTNLQSFLDIYYAGAGVLLHEQDFYDMAQAYLARAAIDNIAHTELFFDPQTHTARGVAMETVVYGLYRACMDAKTEFGISASLIMCFVRHLSEQEAFETLEQALPYRDKIIGVGLDSGEVATPRTLPACLRVAASWGSAWWRTRGKKVRRLTSGVRWTCCGWSELTMVCRLSKTLR